MKKKNTNIKIGIIVSGVILLIGCIFIGIYNLPQNRIERLLETANKYLEEEQYEEAEVAFNKVIAIEDKNISAYLGLITVYEQTENYEELKEVCKQALTALQDEDDSPVEESEVQKIRLVAIKNFERYEDCILELIDWELRIGELPEAWLMWINDYITRLKKERAYDQLLALIERYKDSNIEYDFYALKTEIEAQIEKEKAEAPVIQALAKVLACMEAKDYETLNDLRWEFDDYPEKIIPVGSIYIPEDYTGQNGIGVAYYAIDEYKNYFYYGNFVNGQRNGKAVAFTDSSIVSAYELIETTWENDVPNGEYEYFRSPYLCDYLVTYKEKGTCVNGILNGKITEIEYVEDIASENPTKKEYTFTFTVVDGVPQENVTDEFIRLGGLYDGEIFGNYFGGILLEDGYCYAIGYDEDGGTFEDINLNCIYATRAYSPKDGKLGILEFGANN